MREGGEEGWREGATGLGRRGDKEANQKKISLSKPRLWTKKDWKPLNRSV